MQYGRHLSAVFLLLRAGKADKLLLVYYNPAVLIYDKPLKRLRARRAPEPEHKLTSFSNHALAFVAVILFSYKYSGAMSISPSFHTVTP